MNMRHQQNGTVHGEIQRSPNRIRSFFLIFVLPLAALACGIVITVYLLKTAPQAKPRKRPPTPTLVEVQQVQTGVQQTFIQAMGQIIPAREIDLRPRVSGEVTTLSGEFLPGGYFQAGQTMLALDPADYELMVQQLESEAAKSRSDLLLEMGNQRIAEKEFALLDEAVSPEEKALILRQPQLTKLQASRTVAEARLAQARLDLERTRVKAPFNSVIGTRHVNTGAKVTENTVLAHLIGTDSFWLKLTLPVEQLRWVEIPDRNGEKGSVVRIYPQSNTNGAIYRTGHVIRLEASLEKEGRMAQLLVEVDDPLCRKLENAGKAKLLLGSYVSSEIEGVTIPAGVSVSRSNIHDGNTVWIMNDKGNLDIREVQVTFRSRDRVIVTDGLIPGERIVTSTLASPVAGIPLRLAGTEPATEEAKNKAGKQVKPEAKRRADRAE